MVFFSLLISLFRRALVYRAINKELSAKKQELARLEDKNRALAQKLEEVNRPEFVDKEARELLGLGSPSAMVKKSQVVAQEPVEPEEKEPSNFSRWVALFWY